MIEEVFAAMGTPMESFFDGADVVAEAMASISAAAQGAPTKTYIPSAEPSPTKEGAQTERISEFASIPTKTSTLQKGVTLMATSETESASPAMPLIISTSDSFAILSQAIKDRSSLVVTPSSIPSSAIREPDAYLSFNEGSKEVLEDSDDEPTMKKRVSDSDKEDSGEHETEAIGTYSLHLLGFPSHSLFSPSLLFFLCIYLHNFLTQSLIILHVHSSNHRYS